MSSSTKLAALSRLVADSGVASGDEIAGAALALTCDLVPGARWASLTHRASSWRTIAVSDPRAAVLDEFQYRAKAGPCLDAVRSTTVVASDFASERRWPEFTALALADRAATGSVSCPLAPAGRQATSLNLYTDSAERGAIDRPAAELAASGLALVLTAIEQRSQLGHLEIALETSRSIGAAIGILMHRHRWTYEQAFDAMRHVSQHTHRRLRDIASDVVLIGDLPG